MIREEVAHSDGTHLSCLVSLFQVTIGTVAVAVRLVEEHQVDVVGLQFAQTLVDALHGLSVAIVGRPDLGNEEKIITTDAALLPCAAHGFLVEISLRSIYHPIAHAERIQHATLTLIRFHLIDTITQLRHFHAIA